VLGKRCKINTRAQIYDLLQLNTFISFMTV